MNSPLSPIHSITFGETRVIILIETTTYGESVISIPFLPIDEPIGPIENGMTYIVRPCIHPLYNACIFVFISDGAIQ
ncbi:hypothetical protein TRFO_37741 [Tritrichomonas foetus]|uniref:Uncharacterized protein n=1 Tax=Tritrichomonas foetus TaxID=1144522 RepID=A0A1J4JAC0_9EUKA|nr:hypothetical protein TRFO_37737 [Tritrichomonas foetus]OHS96126.1 hypothetical protein TRFO_37741 [Tritrichomonas foetus]|eukprot:OHS96122.1 hypothetical protein TRFO_37737 [Tritrichomonas foetus]